MMAEWSKSENSGARAVWVPASLCFGDGGVILASSGRLAQTPLLRCQQPSPDGEQVRQRRGHLQAMQVLRQAAVAHLLKAEYAFDHSDAVLDLRAHSGLVAVLHLHRLIDPLTPPVAPVGAIPCPRRYRAQD